MSGTRTLYYSTARITRRHIQNIWLLTGHDPHPHTPCQQHRQLSFLIGNNPSSQPRERILSRTKQSSSERSLSSSSSCQPAAYRSTTINASRQPRLRSRDQHPSLQGQEKSAFATVGNLTPLHRHRCARYSTTSGRDSNTHVGNGHDTGSRDSNVTGDSYPYPYSDPDFLDFEQCKNPVQLEKSVASYLKSHPEPTDQALVAMLTACANLCRASMSPSHSRKHLQPTRQSKDNRKLDSSKLTTTATPSMASNLLETILQSSVFSSEQVFKIARSIHHDLSTRPHPVSGIIQELPSRQRTSSLQVTNAYLDVCAITGHFDDARAVLQEMLDSPQGDVKPDLTTYRHVLRAATAAKRSHGNDQGQDLTRKASIDTSAQEIIEQAVEALSRKARMAFCIKLGLGGLTGATVGKFTMMAIMALPTTRPLNSGDSGGGVQGNSSGESVSTTHMIDALQPTEGIMEFLATQEVATGIGLTVGMLTAGYFILGSTRRPLTAVAAVNRQTLATGKTTTTAQAQELAVDAAVREGGKEEVGSKTRHAQQQQHPHHRHHQHYLSDSLPRAKLFGLYFPDLATTSKDEIRDYLRKSEQS
ncbi:hypothetical protein BGZ95_001406 [Linnemannia exigua]|uniref:Uncharacterized protein n=1 Tax=Linnemannia exigua TaxID=604196 RepID=A0AAD4DKJ4_9FUNG|nr:hypothetical protein BGZ95_001406 [Linnemannia exigua]